MEDKEEEERKKEIREAKGNIQWRKKRRNEGKKDNGKKERRKENILSLLCRVSGFADLWSRGPSGRDIASRTSHWASRPWCLIVSLNATTLRNCVSPGRLRFVENNLRQCGFRKFRVRGWCQSMLGYMFFKSSSTACRWSCNFMISCVKSNCVGYCIRHIFRGVFIFANFASRVLVANLTTCEKYLPPIWTHECDLCTPPRSRI